MSKLTQGHIDTLPDTTKVERKLLSGRYVIQTIGTAGALLNVTAYVNMQQKLEIDRLEQTGTPIIVDFDNIKYTGLIKTAPIAERIKRNVFYISFTLYLAHGETTGTSEEEREIIEAKGETM